MDTVQHGEIKMTKVDKNYAPLTVETLAPRLSSVDAIVTRLGTDISKWKSNEVGDLSLIHI